MLNQRTTLAILTIFVLTSCATNKQLFIGELFSDFDKLKIDEVENFERKNKSKDITPAFLLENGETTYPYQSQYKLEIIPKIFKRKEKPAFQVEIEYYYHFADSSVKVILYQWDEDLSSKLNNTVEDTNTSQKFSRFQTKFNQLSDSLTKVLGTPNQKNIEQAKVAFGETFRDDIKWQHIKGLNAYLYMVGNDETGYRQIRLAVYRP